MSEGAQAAIMSNIEWRQILVIMYFLSGFLILIITVAYQLNIIPKWLFLSFLVFPSFVAAYGLLYRIEFLSITLTISIVVVYALRRLRD